MMHRILLLAYFALWASASALIPEDARSAEMWWKQLACKVSPQDANSIMMVCEAPYQGDTAEHVAHLLRQLIEWSEKPSVSPPIVEWSDKPLAHPPIVVCDGFIMLLALTFELQEDSAKEFIEASLEQLKGITECRVTKDELQGIRKLSKHLGEYRKYLHGHKNQPNVDLEVTERLVEVSNRADKFLCFPEALLMSIGEFAKSSGTQMNRLPAPAEWTCVAAARIFKAIGKTSDLTVKQFMKAIKTRQFPDETKSARYVLKYFALVALTLHHSDEDAETYIRSRLPNFLHPTKMGELVSKTREFRKALKELVGISDVELQKARVVDISKLDSKLGEWLKEKVSSGRRFWKFVEFNINMILQSSANRDEELCKEILHI